MVPAAKISVGIAIAILLVTPASGAEKGKYVALGAGAISCGGWTEERRARSDMAFSYMQWVAGYFTSYNEWDDPHETNILANTNIDSVGASMDNYCAAHPLDTVADAASSVLVEIYQRETKKIINGIKRDLAKSSK